MEKGNAVEMFQLKLAHVGINAQNREQAAIWAKEFQDIFGLETQETPISIFSSTLVEIMKENGLGANGHIGFAVNDCEAALKYFETKGIFAIDDTKRYDAQGKCYFAYLNREIGGFAIHLMQE